MPEQRKTKYLLVSRQETREWSNSDQVLHVEGRVGTFRSPFSFSSHPESREEKEEKKEKEEKEEES